MELLIVFVAVMAMVLIVAFDRRRFLTQVDLRHWKNRLYLMLLPNFLQTLYSRNLRSPWPVRDDEISATFFVLRASRALPPVSRSVQRQFMRCHIHLFALMNRVGPFLQDALLGELQKLAKRQMANVVNSWDYERLSDGVIRIAVLRKSFQDRLDLVDKALAVQIQQTGVLRQLRQVHAIFSEHGYSLLPAFDALMRWEDMNGAELSSEMNRIVDTRNRRGRLPTLV
jgi:hypothetical protein